MPSIVEERDREKETTQMHRPILSMIACLSLVACLALQAQAAERIVIYHYYPRVQTVIDEPAPFVVAYDADDRFARAYSMQGVVTSSVPYHMTVRVHDDVYQVSLHDGTIIRPTGITLAPSMIVNVDGYWSGGRFIANRIIVLRY